MSVRKLGDEFCSLLHRTQLKAKGFKKNGRIYLRDQGAYVEYFGIQGSSWNSGEEPWQFYINVMIKFKNTALAIGGAEYKYHAEGRLESIHSQAPYAYDLHASNRDALTLPVAAYILAASDAIPPLLEPVKSRVARGLYSVLPVPDSWAPL